jgi:hypothetical protein
VNACADEARARGGARSVANSQRAREGCHARFARVESQREPR